MKRFISTKFFISLKKCLQKDIDIRVLENDYNQFVILLFSEGSAINKTEYRNILAYTCVELISLTKVAEKKCRYLFR